MASTTTSTRPSGAWDFTSALELLRSPSPTSIDSAFQLPEVSSAGGASLGDFNRLWNFLKTSPPPQTKKPANGVGGIETKSSAPQKDLPLNFENLAYTSDGGIFASSNRKKKGHQVHWPDEVVQTEDTAGDTVGSVTGDEASLSGSPPKNGSLALRSKSDHAKHKAVESAKSSVGADGKELTPRARKKKRYQANKRRKGEEAAAQRKSKSDAESEAEMESIKRLTPAKKASVHSNRLLSPAIKNEGGLVGVTRPKPKLLYTQSMPEEMDEDVASILPSTPTPKFAADNKTEKKTEKKTEQKTEQKPITTAKQEPVDVTPAPTIPKSERRQKPIQPPIAPKTPTNSATVKTPSKPKLPEAQKAAIQSFSPASVQPTKPVTPYWQTLQKLPSVASEGTARSQISDVGTPVRKPQVKAAVPSPVPSHTIPIIARPKIDRDIDLRLRLIQDFGEDKKYLARPVNMANHNQDPNGVHVFVDFSNIWIGFIDILYHIRQQYKHRTDFVLDRKNKNLSFESLVLLMERGRPVAKRVLAGSPPLMPAMHMAKAIGYNTLILDKVFKIKPLTERQLHFAKQEPWKHSPKRRSGSHNAAPGPPSAATNGTTEQASSATTSGAEMPTSSSSEPLDPIAAAVQAVQAAQAARSQPGGSQGRPSQPGSAVKPISAANTLTITPSSTSANAPADSASYDPLQPTARWHEQGVDEMLHLHMLESIVDYNTPSTMVLGTGDAAIAEFSGGFKEQVERALNRGWKVELVAFNKSIANAYKHSKFVSRWQDQFRIIELDQYAEYLLDEPGAAELPDGLGGGDTSGGEGM